MEKTSRRNFIILGSAAAASAVAATIHGISAADRASDMEPFAPANNAQAIADIFKFSDSDRSYVMQRDYLEGMTKTFAHRANPVALTISQYNEHNFEVKTGHINGEPVVAIREEGHFKGSAKPWQSKLKPEDIYSFFEQPAQPAPQSLKTAAFTGSPKP